MVLQLKIWVGEMGVVAIDAGFDAVLQLPLLLRPFVHQRRRTLGQRVDGGDPKTKFGVGHHCTYKVHNRSIFVRQCLPLSYSVSGVNIVPQFKQGFK